MSGSGREASRVVGRSSQMSGSGRETLPDVWEWSGGPSGCPRVVGGPPRYPGVVGKPFRMSGSGQEALPDIREWLGVPPG